jgi:hypothetical protein
MEHLSPEGQAILDSLSIAAAEQHERHRKEIDAMIVQSVTTAVDAAVRSSVNKAIGDMQLYADGVESSLPQHLAEL